MQKNLTWKMYSKNIWRCYNENKFNEFKSKN